MASRQLLLMIVSILIGCSLLRTSHAGALSDIKEFFTEFSSLGEPAVDVGEEIGRTAQKISKLIQRATPVAAFVSYAASLAFDDKGENIEALKELNKTLLTKLNHMEKRIEHIEHQLDRFSLKEDLRDYDNSITQHLDSISLHLSYILDPTDKRKRTQLRDNFVAECTDKDHSPIKLLQWMNRRLNLKCPLPTQQEAAIHVHGLGLFDVVFSNLGEMTIWSRKQLRRICSEILYALSLYDDLTEAKAELWPIEDALVNENRTSGLLEQRIRALHKKVTGGNKVGDTELCFLKTAIENNDWERQPLLSSAELTETDVLRLTAIGAICANISYTEPADVEVTLNTISKLSTNILTAMSEYVIAKLRTMWPKLMEHYATRALGNQTLNKGDYNKTAENIQKALDMRGEFEYFHMVFLSEADLSKGWQYYVNCSEAACLQIPSVNGVNTVVIRYQDGQQMRAQNASGWYNKTQCAIYNRTHEFYKGSQKQPLTKLFRYLKGKIPGFGTASLYRNTVILHQEGYFSLFLSIDDGIAGATVGAVPAYQMTEHYKNGWGDAMLTRIFSFL